MPSAMKMNGNGHHHSSNEDIVITGLSGRLPESNSIEEFKQQLYDGVDLVTADDRRWPLGLHGLPERNGKLKDLEHFDATYFGVHAKQAHVMDPQLRLLLEATHEAIIDAGLNPQELRGTRTGVFVGVSQSETDEFWNQNPDKINGYTLTGCCRAMFPNRISYTFNLQGPSYAIDTACSSSMFALQQAVTAIRSGQCDAAVVAGCNLCLKPANTLNFHRLSMLSPQGACKAFDSSGNGYVRSEAAVSILIQKRSDARRVYATVINAKTNTDGAKVQGITFPSGEMQKQLILETFAEVGINPNTVSYIEAHGTGTKVGDPQEVNSIADVFCSDRKEPLLIGSVKSNMGHSEPASGLCSLAKILIAMETGVIPANLHFKTPNTDIPALLDGRLRVVDRNMPWNGGLVAVNSFGFGGANAHVILESNPIPKNNKHTYKMPRVLTSSGRTEEAVSTLLRCGADNPNDAELHCLLDKIHSKNIPGHSYRGYKILGTESEEISEVEGASERPVWFVFSGMGSQWAGMAKDLMKLPTFHQSILKCAEALKPHNVDLVKVLTDDKTSFDNVINSFVSIAAMQVALVDVLRTMDIKPDGIVGHSVGEVGCAYADETLTREQAVLCAYWRGRSIMDAHLQAGAMAAVGLSWEETAKRCPADIVPACHNSADSVTISGPVDSINKFVAKLQSEEIFAKAVNSSNVAFHSKYIAAAAPLLKKSLEMVIKHPKKRSERWVSSSVVGDQLDTELARYSSASYHVNNLLSPVRFHDAISHIPENAVVIEIAPHALLQAILKRSLNKGVINVGLVKRDQPDTLVYLLSSIGKLFCAGVEPCISNLYDRIEFPVSRGTPQLASKVLWDHSIEWNVANFGSGATGSGENIIEYDLAKAEDSFIMGHTIDGRVLFPATGYLTLVWRTVAKLNNRKLEDTPLIMEDIQFQRATIMPKEGTVKFLINVLQGTGDFEISENGSVAVKGKVFIPENVDAEKLKLEKPIVQKESQDILPLENADIYKELRLRGYDYGGIFRGIKSSDARGVCGSLEWNDNWISYMDTMLQFGIIGVNTRELYLPTRLQRAVIDPKAQMDALEKGNQVPVYMHRDIDVIQAGGVELRGVKTSLAPRRTQAQAEPKLERYAFVPYDNSAPLSSDAKQSKTDALTVLLQIVLENASALKLKIVEAGTGRNVTDLLAQETTEILESEPQVRVDTTVAAGTQSSAYGPALQPLSIKVNNKDVATGKVDDKCHLGLSVGLLEENNVTPLKNLVESLLPNGMILLEENKGVYSAKTDKIIKDANLIFVARQSSISKELLLFRLATDVPKDNVVIRVNNKEYSWVEPLKNALKEAENNDIRVYLVSESTPTSGILGLGTCLRQEPGGSKVKLFFLMDKSAKFSVSDKSFEDVLKRDLAVNVLIDGKWGCNRHLKLEGADEMMKLPVEHAYINTLTRGDLASLRWIESDLGTVNEQDLPKNNLEMCKVYYAPLNFRDIMLATGKLPPDALPGNLAGQDCILGLEFSGRDSSNNRVMGMIAAKGLATSVVADKTFLWKIPDNWTLEQAATVPVVYATAYYALCVRGHLQKSESALIHAGSGGVGQAAIAIALHMGCNVFTTVGSADKREFLIKNFPKLKPENIGNSRDTTFEQLIRVRTAGKGVDVVLNSLAGDKLQASVRCLAVGGRFLEIGKLDLSNNTPLGMSIFLKNTSFHGILLDALFEATVEEKMEVVKCLNEGLKSGAVKPLPATVYSDKEIEQAFRYMATGKHIGKVLLKVRDEEKSNVKPTTRLVEAIPKTYMHPDKAYVLVGGLGGFGMELANWLVTRGATKLVLTSRSGVKTGYQSWCIRRWKESGIKVLVSKEDVVTLDGAKRLLSESAKLGPIGGIFNLAAVLKDAFMENQNADMFSACAKPKIDGTENLDISSRQLAPQLDYFVVFSSVSCGRGNAGQANYGLANSVMERIVEQRQKDGLPGLAIQWGAIGDVGLVADNMGGNDVVVGGTLPQRISSCLNAMSQLMAVPHPVTASLVLAEKRKAAGGVQQDLSRAVANILGIKDPSKIQQNANLADLGMDSLMGAEIKQTLERNYDLVLGVQEIRGLTFGKLKQLSSGDAAEVINGSSDDTNQVHLATFGELMPKRVLVKLPSKVQEDPNASPFFVVHPIEGVVDILRNVCKNVNGIAYGLQCTADAPMGSMSELAAFYIQHVTTRQQKGPYLIVGYSFGAAVAFEMTLQLEKAGHKVELILIDGSPEYVATHTRRNINRSDRNQATDEADALSHFSLLFKETDTTKMSHELQSLPTFEARLEATSRIIASATSYEPEALSVAAHSYYRKLLIGDIYKPTTKLNATVTLLSAKDNHVTLGPDYGLDQICNMKPRVISLEGNHITILSGKSSQMIAEQINNAIKAIH